MNKIVAIKKDRRIARIINNDVIYMTGVIVGCVAASVAVATVIEKIIPVKEETE